MIIIIFCASPISLYYSFFSYYIDPVSSYYYSLLSCCVLCLTCFLSFYGLYDMDCLFVCCSSSYRCVLFLFVIMISSLFFSLVTLRCFCFAFECKQQQATRNNTQTSRITKEQLLKTLTCADVQESKKGLIKVWRNQF